jgi:hypothetical protein
VIVEIIEIASIGRYPRKAPAHALLLSVNLGPMERHSAARQRITVAREFLLGNPSSRRAFGHSSRETT